VEFHYRFVPFGTHFTTAQGMRAAGDATNVSALYENELAVDVGGRQWGIEGESGAVLDHHLIAEGRAPSASAAALHRAEAIRARFRAGGATVTWLVTHRDPDFDAFTAMYLARCLIDEDALTCDWLAHGIDPDGWFNVGLQRPRIDWFDPHAADAFPPNVRWAVRLAGYASTVDHARRIACARSEALHSVLYAALERGRPYLDEQSGATELYAEARARLEAGANPFYDAVLSGSATFAPELALLRRETELYERDVARARRSIAFVPEAPADFAAAYTAAQQIALEPLAAASMQRAELLQGERRRAVDAIYLRDPDCLLFKEWARIDTRNTVLGSGFAFTCIAYTKTGEAGGAGRLDYFVSLDPEQGRGLQLYRVWAALQNAEVEALQRAAHPPARGTIRFGYEARAGAYPGFDDPWYDGVNYACTIVAGPSRGTAIGPAGSRPGMEDDPVAAIVRAELEDCAFAGDVEAAAHVVRSTAEPKRVCYRFGSVMLAPGVDVLRDAVALQIAGRLWTALLDEQDRVVPTDILEAFTYRRPDLIAVWLRSGVALAYLRSAEAAAREIAEQFTEVVEITGEVVALTSQPNDGVSADGKAPATREALEARVARGGELLRRLSRLRSSLASSRNGDLIGAFVEKIGFDDVLATFHALNRTEVATLQTAKMDLQTAQIVKHAHVVADVQVKVEWLELLFVGVYATELCAVIATALQGRYALLFTMIGSVVLTIAAASYLRPWVNTHQELADNPLAVAPAPSRRPPWLPMLVAGVLLLVIGTAAALYETGWPQKLLHFPSFSALHTPEQADRKDRTE
jgi:hypothetical protein